MNTHEAIKFIRKRLQVRHLQKCLLIAVVAFLYITSFTILLAFFSHTVGLSFFSIAFCSGFFLAFKKGFFKRFTELDAAHYLDEHLGSKNRFTSFIELRELNLDSIKSDFLALQLEKLLTNPSSETLPKLELHRSFFRLRWGLLIPWLGVASLFFYESLKPPYNPEQVALLEEVLKKHDEFPPELKKNLQELKNALEKHPLLDDPVSEALAETEETLQDFSDEKMLGESARNDKILDETPQPTSPEKQETIESPSPTPELGLDENKENKRSEPKEEEKKQQQTSDEQKQQKQEQGQKREGQGKDSKQQSQDENSKSAQGNGQGQGKASGQGQAEQQSGQGTGSNDSQNQKNNSQSEGSADKNKEQQQSENKGNKSKENQGEGQAQGQEGKEGAKDGSSQKEKDESSQGSDKSQGNKESPGLNDAKKALDELKKQIEKEKGNNNKEGKEKGSDSKNGKESSKQNKEQGQANKDKEKQPSSDSQKNEEKEPEKSEKEMQSENQSSGKQRGKSAMPVPGEKGQTPDFSMALGTKEQERSRIQELNIPPGDDKFDSRFGSKDGEAVQNKKGALPKTSLADVELAKPETRKGVEEQYVPPEYEGILGSK